MIDKRKLLKEEQERLLGKWEPFLEGIDDDYTRINTAMLLENEAEYLVEAANNTAAADVIGIQKIMLPIVRRVFPNLIANNIVSVQPMAGPAAVIFYLKYVFGTTKGNVTQGSEYSAFAATAPLTHPDEGWQGYSPYYSKQSVGPFVANNSGNTATFAMNVLTASHTYASMQWAAALSGAAAVEGTIIREEATSLDSGVEGGEIIYSFTGTAGTSAGVVYDVYGNVSTDFTVTGMNGNTITVTRVGHLDNFKVEVNYEINMEFSEDLPEMKITISQIPVVAKTRKLKAHWSNEAEQDLKAYHNLNAEAELTSLVSNEMIAEIDREIVKKCMFSASTRDKFNWRWDTNNNTAGNFLDRHLALVNKIIEVSNEIYRKSKIGPANWVVTSTKISSQLETLRGFIPNPVTATGGLGIVKAGNYAGKFDVYKDPLFPEEKILMGHKSPVSPFGAGVVYAPYVTQLTPVIYGPDDFTPRRGFIARYGLVKVPLGELLYALMDVDFSSAEGTV
jgi:hypothetical protein